MKGSNSTGEKQIPEERFPLLSHPEDAPGFSSQNRMVTLKALSGSKAGITSETEMLLYFAGFQAGFTMILKYWVEQGCTESTEKIAEIIQNTVPSVWKTVITRENI